MPEVREKLLGKFGPFRRRVLDRELFLFLLDLEVKRARRYQNFFCLMLLNIIPITRNEFDEREIDCQRLGDILLEETRESDMIGFLTINRLAILLPYADTKAGDQMQSRFENTLRYYDFKGKQFEVSFKQICFPVNEVDTMDIIRETLYSESS